MNTHCLCISKVAKGKFRLLNKANSPHYIVKLGRHLKALSLLDIYITVKQNK